MPQQRDPGSARPAASQVAPGHTAPAGRRIRIGRTAAAGQISMPLSAGVPGAMARVGTMTVWRMAAPGTVARTMAGRHPVRLKRKPRTASARRRDPRCPLFRCASFRCAQCRCAQCRCALRCALCRRVLRRVSRVVCRAVLWRRPYDSPDPATAMPVIGHPHAPAAPDSRPSRPLRPGLPGRPFRFPLYLPAVGGAGNDTPEVPSDGEIPRRFCNKSRPHVNYVCDQR